ncbi:DUF2147 domain-containing protein [Methylorubrum aminovorans]|uniref:DUF2147 domain-containing protein n=1 Tax=Methylorubrum aminovorans TaxID=269069 RepID=A0ABQ4UGX6_9HYPH|nr:DUF2147 domain-containing protein [Methylorubrum aminovorans]AWI90110.1 DUF2147 domain-containing protein [Methylobacterium sp. DM1]GJE66556.1 hypothetical protein LNAOJCKE_3776 [Methylorubrum aminovorans]GMA74085.1 hypothetical protein GCM10025880_05020 [Methylorubrum aminovorans]
MIFGPIGAGAPFLRTGRAAALAAGLAGLAALSAVPASAAAPARDPSGTWLTQDGKARIRVEKCGPQEKNLCGYAVWLKTPLNDEGKPRVDFRNPDPKKRTRASLGHQLILGLKLNDEAHYEGKIYNAEDGKFYDVTIWSDEPEELTVKGCLIAFLCQSQSWKRVSDALPGQLTGPTNGPNGPRADAEWAPKAAPGATANGPAATGTAGQAPAAKPAPKPAAPKAPAAPAPAQ